MDRSEGERRAAQRPKDQPETEGKRPSGQSGSQRDNNEARRIGLRGEAETIAGENLQTGIRQTAAQLRLQLAQMTAASQLLERCAFEEKSREYLAAMNQGICRMLRIVGRMELSGRLGGETAAVKPAPTDLGALTADLGARMEGLLERAGVKLTVKGPERLIARADGELIRQLLLELVANGAKAGKSVTLTLKRDGDNAVFTVEDDGPGVRPEKLPFLFDSSAQELPDWRRSGNGIAIARRIAALHGGRLVPVCTAGRGLLVTASIPPNRGGDDALQCPAVEWDRGGFDEAVVGLSHLLPAGVFAPGEYV